MDKVTLREQGLSCGIRSLIIRAPQWRSLLHCIHVDWFMIVVTSDDGSLRVRSLKTLSKNYDYLV